MREGLSQRAACSCFCCSWFQSMRDSNSTREVDERIWRYVQVSSGPNHILAIDSIQYLAINRFSNRHLADRRYFRSTGELQPATAAGKARAAWLLQEQAMVVTRCAVALQRDEGFRLRTRRFFAEIRFHKSCSCLANSCEVS